MSLVATCVTSRSAWRGDDVWIDSEEKIAERALKIS